MLLRQERVAISNNKIGFHPTQRWDPWLIAAGIVALLVALPILVVLSSLLTPSTKIWVHLWDTQLVEIIWNTLALIIGVGSGVLFIGVGLAWLVSMYRFPGQRVFEWLLILPLAVPTYVFGFVFLAFFDFTGPLQSWLRNVFGRDVWFPEVASYGGVTVVMVLVLYPYVYVLARTAFREQAVGIVEAARSLGSRQLVVFWRVALPLARPFIAAGLVFALMEALADFGTVAVFGYSTFTVAIYKIWFGMFERGAATELASLLVFFTMTIYLMELAGRGRTRFFQTEGAVRSVTPKLLRGWKSWIASGTAALVVLVAFIFPITILLSWVVKGVEFEERYLQFFANTLLLGLTTSFLAVCAAVIMAYGLRLSRCSLVTFFGRLATMGYALPGSVIAVGVIVPLAYFDHSLDSILETTFGISTGLLLTGTVVGLIFAYLVRFLAISLQTVEASLIKITPNMDMAARSLGISKGRRLWHLHLPLIRGGLSSAAILVFVDVMKEMPATLLLRPFGYETLAVRVWQLTSEALWEAAALPALTIVAAGIIPVILLVKTSPRLAYR